MEEKGKMEREVKLHKELEYKINEIKKQSDIIYDILLKEKIKENFQNLRYFDDFYKSYVFSPLKSNENILEKFSKNILERINFLSQKIINSNIIQNSNEKLSNNEFLNLSDNENNNLFDEENQSLFNKRINKNLLNNNEYKKIFKFFPSLSELLDNQLQEQFLSEIKEKFKHNDILYILCLILEYKLIECDIQLEQELLNLYKQRQVQKINYLEPIIYAQKNIYFLKIFPYEDIQILVNYNKKNSQMPKWHESWNLKFNNSDKIFKDKIKNPLVNKNFNALKNYLYQFKKEFNKDFYNFYNVVYFNKSVDLNFNFSAINNKFPKSNDFIFKNVSPFYNLLNQSNSHIQENKLEKFLKIFNNDNLEIKDNNVFFYNLENIIYDYSQQELKNTLIYFDKYTNGIIKLQDQIPTPYNFNYIQKFLKDKDFSIYSQFLFKNLANTFFMYPIKLVEIYQKKKDYLNTFFNFFNQESLNFLFDKSNLNENLIENLNSNNFNSKLNNNLIQYIKDFYENINSQNNNEIIINNNVNSLNDNENTINNNENIINNNENTINNNENIINNDVNTLNENVNFKNNNEIIIKNENIVDVNLENLEKIMNLFFKFLDKQLTFNERIHQNNIVKGALGESYILYYLKKILKNEYIFFDNLYLPHPKLLNSLIQIDGLIVSPYGIFVLEIKNFSALEIKGNVEDKYWTLIYPNNEKQEINNILKQNLSHIKHLQGLLGLDEKYFISMIIIENINSYLTEIKINENLQSVIFSLTKALKEIENFKQEILSKKEIFQIQSILKNIRYLDSDTKIRQLNSNYKNSLFYIQTKQQQVFQKENIKNINLKLNIENIFKEYIFKNQKFIIEADVTQENQNIKENISDINQDNQSINQEISLNKQEISNNIENVKIENKFINNNKISKEKISHILHLINDSQNKSNIDFMNRDINQIKNELNNSSNKLNENYIEVQNTSNQKHILISKTFLFIYLIISVLFILFLIYYFYKFL